MKTTLSLVLVFLIILLSACDAEVEKGVMKSDLSKDVSLTTELGEIIVRLSDGTPKHRNNFIKLVNQGFYDSIAFHRVIESFLIQTGNPETRGTPILDTASPNTLPAEINQNLFHKRGALNAARMGDDYNPNQASSGTQFTIIQGKTYTDSTLAVAEKRINNWLAYNHIINTPKHKVDFEAYSKLLGQLDSLQSLKRNEDKKKLEDMKLLMRNLKTKLDSLTDVDLVTRKAYSYPEAHREVYKSLGGAAHLDQNYVVFGEVVKGMDIVDRIAAVQTDSFNKPVKDIRILSAKMIKRTTYP